MIQWTTGDADGGFEGLGGNPARVGLNAGDGIHFVNVSGSQTPSVIDIVNTSNVCIGGMWIFRVDEPFVNVDSSSEFSYNSDKICQLMKYNFVCNKYYDCLVTCCVN